LKNEVTTIHQIAKNNGMDIYLNFNRIIKKFRYSVALKQTSLLQPLAASTTDAGELKFIRQPFLGKMSYRLASTLRRSGYQPAYYTVCTFRSLFSKLKDPLPVLQRNGVYKLSRSQCPEYLYRSM
jgi:hypothetical protein